MGLLSNLIGQMGRLGNFFVVGLPAAQLYDPIEQQIIRNLEAKAPVARYALLRAAEDVLGGPRHGHVYTRNGLTWQASGPGEPPAERTGELRFNWTLPDPVIERTPTGAKVTISIQSRTPYVRFFDPNMPGFIGTSRFAPRPFVDEVIQQAAPQVMRAMAGAPFLSLEGL